ncbi:hypothetical protein BLA29_002805 [Euroglyphus maynei]|uniref:Uncharacterized protein n=1 Tax=Euroglyphus maynei TaxID=6958 RepID=A0A1Y3BV89_EURMA|nr:hypothetical protein BLA29_002805 [Euroglyphus maynei]
MASNEERDDDNMITTLYPYAIRKANMDGTHVTIFGEQLDLSTNYISSLAIDTEQAFLYWADTGEKTLNRMNYMTTKNASKRDRLWQSSRITMANSLFYFNDTLFWAEIQHGSIQQFDLKTNHSKFIVEERAPLFQIKIWSPKHNNSRSKICFDGIKQKREHRCQQLTLSTSGDLHSVCACDDHYESINEGKCRQLSAEQLSKKFCASNQVYLIRGRRCVRKSFIHTGSQETTNQKSKNHRSHLEPDKDETIENDEQVNHEHGTEKKQCREKEFQCDNGQRCIPYHWLCDGHKDCHDQTDERTICQVISPPDFHCPDGYFQCRNRPLCIPKEWRCDHQPDCGDDDHSDEQNCSHH